MLSGECSAGTLSAEEGTLSDALRVWGEADIEADEDDAKVQALTRIMALAKTAGLMHEDGKLCLCI